LYFNGTTLLQTSPEVIQCPQPSALENTKDTCSIPRQKLLESIVNLLTNMCDLKKLPIPSEESVTGLPDPLAPSNNLTDGYKFPLTLTNKVTRGFANNLLNICDRVASLT
jgi:hypothetical protein